jgi:hypothetical protein
VRPAFGYTPPGRAADRLRPASGQRQIFTYSSVHRRAKEVALPQRSQGMEELPGREYHSNRVPARALFRKTVFSSRRNPSGSTAVPTRANDREAFFVHATAKKTPGRSFADKSLRFGGRFRARRSNGGASRLRVERYNPLPTILDCSVAVEHDRFVFPKQNRRIPPTVHRRE